MSTHLTSLSAGILCLARAALVLSFARQVFTDLYTGEARELGIFRTAVIVTILIISISVILIYFGYHGVIGKLVIN